MKDYTEEEIDKMCEEEGVILPVVEEEDEYEIEPTD